MQTGDSSSAYQSMAGNGLLYLSGRAQLIVCHQSEEALLHFLRPLVLFMELTYTQEPVFNYFRFQEKQSVLYSHQREVTSLTCKAENGQLI